MTIIGGLIRIDGIKRLDLIVLLVVGIQHLVAAPVLICIFNMSLTARKRQIALSRPHTPSTPPAPTAGVGLHIMARSARIFSQPPYIGRRRRVWVGVMATASSAAIGMRPTT